MGDVFLNPVFAGSEIVLHDINPTALQRVYEFGQRHIQDNNLPSDNVVEVPAIIRSDGVPLGKFKPGFGGLLLNQCTVHDLTAEAVLKRSKNAAPLVELPVIRQIGYDRPDRQ